MERIERPSTGDIVLIGDILVDNICWVDKLPKSGNDVAILKYSQQSGGSAANTCCVLSDLGACCSFCGAIGNDGTGEELTRRLKEKGIDISCLQVSDSKTGFTYTMVEPDGERTMLSYRDASSVGMKYSPELAEAVKKAKVLYISGYLLSVKEQAEFVFEAAAAARAAGTVTMLDTSPVIGTVDRSTVDRMLELTDVLMPNRRELFELSGTEDLEESIAILLEKVPVIVTKLGGAGSRIDVKAGCTLPGFESGEAMSCSAPANRVRPVDTTGAGDSYNAGFLASYLINDTPEQCLRRGNYIAAQVISGNLPRSIMF